MKLLWFCASGDSFFLGTGLLIASMVFSLSFKGCHQRLILWPASIVGTILILMSGASFNSLFYIGWGIVTLAWFVFFILQKRIKQQIFRIVAGIAIFMSMTALLLEIPFHLKPEMGKQKFETFYIVGDSLSAGIHGNNEMTWPKIFKEKYKINVVDLSAAGATVGSAYKQAIQINENSLVLLEIGGNDLFGETPYDQYKTDLDVLLKRIVDGKREVVMLELPLFPWQITYGKIQRELAKQYGVTLVPKRFFVDVLSVEGVSEDIAHLTRKGHELMAEKLWWLLKDNLATYKD